METFQYPTTFTVLSPLKIFWKQALQAILLAIGILLLGMTLLLFIPKKNEVKKIHLRTNSPLRRQFFQVPTVPTDDKLREILQFKNINYWRGNWAGDNYFSLLSNCKSELKMLTLNGNNYTEKVLKSRHDIEFFKKPCTSLVFGFTNNEIITWQMDYYRPSTFWTERTIFGSYGPMKAINRKKFYSKIGYPHFCLKTNCFVTAVPKKKNNFRILIHDNNSRQIIISDKRKFLFCGVQDTNTENYLTFGSGYDKNFPIFLNTKNICLYVCYDMSDGEFSYEHPFINYGHTNGAILMKPNTPKISKLSLHLVKIDEENLYLKNLTNKKTEVRLPKEINPRSYFVGCQWFEDYATVVITSRNFQTTWYLSCSYKKPRGKCKVLWTKDWTLTKGYSDILSAGFNDGSELLTVTPSDSEKRTSQIIIISAINRNIYSLTPDFLFVVELLRWDKVNEIVYYIATKMSNPEGRYLYKSTVANWTTTEAYCLTCVDENPSKSELVQWPKCHYSSVTFSPEGSYYLLDCLDDKGNLENFPETFIVSTESNEIVVSLDHRQFEKETYSKVFQRQAKFKFFQCPIADGKYKARIKLQLPPEFTPDKKYSLIMGIDSRIGSQQVNRKWKCNIGTYASIEKEYIYAVADVRGSGYQGYEFESELYNNIGGPEVEDLADVLHWMLNNLSYIDVDNIFLQGEQYGGMVAILLALKEQNLIKAVSVYHPPLFWTGTTAFFAERLLRLPTIEDNYYGYKEKSIGQNVTRYRNMKILIVMDMSTSSGGHSQQISMIRDKMNNESYPFEFMNVIELCYGSVIERARHKLSYYQMMFQYFDKYNRKNY